MTTKRLPVLEFDTTRLADEFFVIFFLNILLPCFVLSFLGDLARVLATGVDACILFLRLHCLYRLLMYFKILLTVLLYLQLDLILTIAFLNDFLILDFLFDLLYRLLPIHLLFLQGCTTF